jgi:hypothetical protein
VPEVRELRLHASGPVDDKVYCLGRLGVAKVPIALRQPLRVEADLPHGLLQIMRGDVGDLPQVRVGLLQVAGMVRKGVFRLLQIRNVGGRTDIA